VKNAGKHVTSHVDVIDQIIWNNNNIVVDNRFSKNTCFVRKIDKIGDLQARANFLKARRYWQQFYPQLNILSSYGLCRDAIPIEWRLIIK